MSAVVVIRAVAFANGEPCPHAGEFLKTFDHEAYDGRGFGTFTRHVAEAMHFPDHPAAFEFWRRVPKCKRRRPDGKPNRPLTALTVEIYATVV